MPLAKSELRLNHQFSKLPSCTLDIEYFKKLQDMLSIGAAEARDFTLSKLVKNVNQSDEEFAKYKEDYAHLLKMNIIIFGTKGEVIATEDEFNFESRNLPDQVSNITFDSSFNYQGRFQGRPPAWFKLDFDFRKVSVFDFDINPWKRYREYEFIDSSR